MVELSSLKANNSLSTAPREYNSYHAERTSTVDDSSDGVDHGLNQTCELIARAMNLIAVFVSVSYNVRKKSADPFSWYTTLAEFIFAPRSFETLITRNAYSRF